MTESYSESMVDNLESSLNEDTKGSDPSRMVEFMRVLSDEDGVD